MRVVWDSILTIRRGDESCPPTPAEMTLLQKPGLPSIMLHHARDGWPARKWHLARNVLKTLAKSECNRLDDVRQQREFRLPAVLRPDVAIRRLQHTTTHANNKGIFWEARTATSLTTVATREMRLILMTNKQTCILELFKTALVSAGKYGKCAMHWHMLQDLF